MNDSERIFAAASADKPSAGTTIYRPFFLAGLATVLTLGCVWGAINLLAIGLNQNFSTISYSWILAHGHAMVFGFVGFFIMGFAYQVFPRFKQTSLWRPGLAFSSLPLMVGGIALQTVAHLIVPSRAAMPMEIIAATIQLASVFIFALVIINTARRANKPEVQDRFVYAALVWFVIAAIANPIIFKLFELPGSRDQLLFNLATFNIPYRDVQLLGIAIVMILGVSLRLLPQVYGLREPSKAWRNFLFWGVNGALVVGATSFVAGMTGHNHWLLMLQWLSTIALLVIALGTPRQFRLFGPMPEGEKDRSLKFIRTAWIWFIVATVMLVCVPVYNFGIYMPLTGSRVPFSHAFFGAYRHAITVGFIMMMIVGVSSRVVPAFAGVALRQTASLWPTFILLNLGNAMRVTFQIATDFTPNAFPIMGASGFIEVVGLSLWAYELVKNMRVGVENEKRHAVVDRRPVTAAAKTRIGDVLSS
jgi:NnrS protein